MQPLPLDDNALLRRERVEAEKGKTYTNNIVQNRDES
jgi:hypothetical protein